MAKKKVQKVNVTAEPKTEKPVRLDLSLADHERLERHARKRGLNKASFVRMVILRELDAMDRET